MTDGRHAVSLISPLASAGRADEVVQRVSQAIQLGLFVDGEQLPPEADFAVQLGVSAMTLREALATLRQRGLVETRRGRTGGTFVRRPVTPAIGLLRDRLRDMTTSALRDLTDEQYAVSGAAAKLAADRAASASVRRLVMLADQLAKAPTLAGRIRTDSRFHIEVAIASQSERLTRLEVGLQTQLAELLWLPHTDPRPGPGPGGPGPDPDPDHGGGGRAGPARDLDRAELLDPVAVAAEHREIALAISIEDGERARVLAERHVERNLRRLTALRLAMAQGQSHLTQG
jgi:GntR family transcriptional regulator, transcriptional repressor for pyruvate dehydrogenase complex